MSGNGEDRIFNGIYVLGQFMIHNTQVQYYPDTRAMLYIGLDELVVKLDRVALGSD